MKNFLVVTQRGPGFTPEILARHIDYLNNLRTKNQVLFSGSFSDYHGGAAVFRAGHRTEIEEILANDPIIAEGASTIVVLQEWNIREVDWSN